MSDNKDSQGLLAEILQCNRRTPDKSSGKVIFEISQAPCAINKQTFGAAPQIKTEELSKVFYPSPSRMALTWRASQKVGVDCLRYLPCDSNAIKFGDFLLCYTAFKLGLVERLLQRCKGCFRSRVYFDDFLPWTGRDAPEVEFQEASVHPVDNGA
ncbi:hypothetical protein PoB_000939200 [Plakobranchus ocellatus]|uniref:Uncharacterized protein n=1 Tax=Plakobranchus ocellatus TaxID=259542 RepID=A0AAV3YKG0_9GAST|nr:hypothetical protein PoB_000939200 [Plakobranchus ocellatus]